MSELKAMVVRGHLRTKVVKVSQFCNDWFMLDTGNPKLDCKPVSPSSLAFTPLGMSIIIKNNPGIMFKLYKMDVAPLWCKEYSLTFIKRNNNAPIR